MHITFSNFNFFLSSRKILNLFLLNAAYIHEEKNEKHAYHKQLFVKKIIRLSFKLK